jgi:hypothetical protein
MSNLYENQKGLIQCFRYMMLFLQKSGIIVFDEVTDIVKPHARANAPSESWQNFGVFLVCNAGVGKLSMEKVKYLPHAWRYWRMLNLRRRRGRRPLVIACTEAHH